MLVLTSGGDDRPIHDASTLLSMIGQLTQLLDGSSSAVADVESWLLRLCKEQTVGALLLDALNNNSNVVLLGGHWLVP